MLNYIAEFPNELEDQLNMDFLDSSYDEPMENWVLAVMQDLESRVSNIDIIDYTIVGDQDDIDINNHLVNINYKKKDLSSIYIPKHKYIQKTRFYEMNFTIRVHTNRNEKTIVKRILLPTIIDGVGYINGKKMRIIWQMVDASTYSRRGQITMKSRLPNMIYCNKHKSITDAFGTEYSLPMYSYAQDSTRKRGGRAAKKKQIKFINPLLIFMTKMGLKKTLKFWGMHDIIKVKKNYTKKDEKECRIFECNDVYVTAPITVFDREPMVQAFVAMFVLLQNRDFPVTIDVMEDKEYWMCRLGFVGSAKNKNLNSFLEKGRTSIHMFEILTDVAAEKSLRLPDIYKSNIYYIMYWMITNFDSLKNRVNIDMANKRIRKNEAIVMSTLGRKISENLIKVIERKTKSKMNTMDTLLEIFNFDSGIILTGMRNMNDIVKSDDSSNDMAFLDKFAYTNKGPNSLGEGNSKNIADKYRYLHPSMVGKVDLFTTSNSDCGMSGSIVPFVKLYDKFFFTPEPEPCKGRYRYEIGLKEEHGIDHGFPIDTFEDFEESWEKYQKQFEKDLAYEPIEIVEREVKKS